MSTATQAIPSGCKQTELGVFPNDWDIVPLSKLCHSICDGTHYTPQYVTSGVAFYSVENVTADDFVNTKFISELEHRTLIKRCKPERGDILMTRITAGILGDTKLIDWDVNASIYVSLALLKPSNLICAEYLYRYTRSSSFRRNVEKRGLANATPKKINMEAIGGILVPVPASEKEQQAIAEALSDADALIESLDQMLAKKRDIKQGAMQELLTGKKRLPGFNGEWRNLSIGRLFNISGGLSASRDQLSHDGHCYLHYGDIHGSSKTFIDVDAEYQQIPKLDVPLSAVSPSALLNDGDVVFVDASEDVDGTNKHVVIANPHNVPFISGLHTIVAKPKGNDLNPLYCRYCFQTEAVKAQFRFFAVGTKVSGVSKTSIAKIEILAPKPNEQIAIAEILCDMDAEISTIKSKLTKARQIKQGMMQELLTGRIRLV